METKKLSWRTPAFVLVLGLASAGLAFTGLAFVGCDSASDPNTDSADSTGNEDAEKIAILPPSNGENPVSGMTYFDLDEKIAFSTTAGAAFGKYTHYLVNRNADFTPVLENGKYTYIEKQTGSYSWDETQKTITLRPEKAAIPVGLASSKYGPIMTPTECWAALEKTLAEYKETLGGDAALSAMLAKWGFSDPSFFLDFYMAKIFAATTHNYAFAAGTKSLFLDKALPANKGVNELAGKTYYGVDQNENQDTNEIFTFTDTECTHTVANAYDSQTYMYAYDSTITPKLAYFKMPTMDRESVYDNSRWREDPAADFFPSDEDFHAALVNDHYKQGGELSYDPARLLMGIGMITEQVGEPGSPGSPGPPDEPDDDSDVAATD